MKLVVCQRNKDGDMLARHMHKFWMVLLLLSTMQACDLQKTQSTIEPQTTSTQKKLNGINATLFVDAIDKVELLGVEFFADIDEQPFYRSAITKLGNRSTMALPLRSIPEHVRLVWRKKDDWGPLWWRHPQASDDSGNAIPGYQSQPIDPRVTNTQLLQLKVERRKLIAKSIGYVHQGPWGGEYFGQAAGDYTIPIASRVPDDVIKDIRARGGGLRLKFRLKPDGVLFGWDIERFSSGQVEYSMPGGDFREAGLAYELPGGLVYRAYLGAYTASATPNPAVQPYLDSGEYFVPPRSGDVWRKGWYIDRDGRKVFTEY
jgi:hypothetical protein